MRMSKFIGRRGVLSIGILLLLYLTGAGSVFAMGPSYYTSSMSAGTDGSSIVIEPGSPTGVLSINPNGSGLDTVADPTFTVAPPSAGSSTLTIKEMELVMGPGKHVDLKTGKRTVRPAMSGLMRENFLMSWEAQRKRVGAHQGIPANLSYSIATKDSFVRFD